MSFGIGEHLTKARAIVDIGLHVAVSDLIISGQSKQWVIAGSHGFTPITYRGDTGGID